MPSAITHQLIAEEAGKRLPSILRTAIEEAPAAFFLGAQGPDPFFFATASKEKINFGKYLHRHRVYELFTIFAGFLKKLPKEQRSAPLAYCLGYVSHYCADVAFHPFVYRYMEQHCCKPREHQRIENDWDVYFARKLRGQEAERYPFPDVTALESAIKPLWKHASSALGQMVPHGAMKSALVGFQKYLMLFHRKCYASQRRWARLDKLLHIRALSCMYPAREPQADVLGGEAFERAANAAGLPPVQRAEDLFERAVSTSTYRMLLFWDAVGGAALPREEFDRNLLTGEHIEEPDSTDDIFA